MTEAQADIIINILDVSSVMIAGILVVQTVRLGTLIMEWFTLGREKSNWFKGPRDVD